MGIFRKESHTQFIRDPDTGEVTEVIRSGDTPKQGWFRSKTPTSDALEREYYRKHPEEHHRTRKKIAGFAKKMDQRIVRYNRTSNPMGGHSFLKPYSVNNNFNPFGSMFDTGMSKSKGKKKSGGKTKYIIRDGKAYPVVGTGKKSKKKKKNKKTGNPMGWDDSFFKW